MHHQILKSLQRGLALTTLAGLALLSACGGGTSQIDPFAPTRIISFGDETSAILTSGKKFGVNGVNLDTQVLDCRLNPNWVQSLATAYNMVFSQCNPDGVAIPQGIMYATPGDKVADFQTKLERHFSVDRFGPKDMVTVMVGANDILELYRQFPAQSRDSLITEAASRGRQLAAQVNRIAAANGRVLISTVYEQGLTPFGDNERTTQTDIDRATLLNDLTDAFNVAMRLALTNDGRLIGLVLADETVQQLVRFPAAFGLTDVTHSACRSDIGPSDCTTNTLQSDASIATWLWANNFQLGPSGQSRISTLALSRARNNPF
jgi:lysophospholipase L1-like esterase